jgi:hypothetical protein
MEPKSTASIKPKKGRLAKEFSLALHKQSSDPAKLKMNEQDIKQSELT